MSGTPPRQRRKHQNKDLEKIIKGAEKKMGCRIEDPPKGRPFKILCSCPEKHMTIVHRTPEGRWHKTTLLAELRSWTCWRQEDE